MTLVYCGLVAMTFKVQHLVRPCTFDGLFFSCDDMSFLFEQFLLLTVSADHGTNTKEINFDKEKELGVT